METRPASASRPAAETTAPDWRPAQGIIDRMLAYREWWNIPSARGAQPRRPGRGRFRPAPGAERSGR